MSDSFSINTVTLSGRLTRDPELRATQQGVSICNFDIAHDESYKEAGTWQKRPNYFKVIVWGTVGEIAAKQLTKGAMVVVSGSLHQNTWEANDGTKREKVEITADSLVYDNRGQQQSGSPHAQGGFDDMGENSGGDDIQL